MASMSDDTEEAQEWMGSEEVQEQWMRMVENVNDAVATSVEQNIEASSKFMEAWSEAVEDSVPEEEEIEESVEAYNAAYQVWMDAADRMFQRLNDAAEGEEVDPTEFRDIWLQSANEAFKEVMGTAAFADATGDLVGRMTELQQQYEEMNEDALARVGMPTRSDVDEVGERLVELERRQHEVEQRLDRVLDHLEEE